MIFYIVIIVIDSYLFIFLNCSIIVSTYRKDAVNIMNKLSSRKRVIKFAGIVYSFSNLHCMGTEYKVKTNN